MNDADRTVVVHLSVEEAYELLNRCLASPGDDTPLFREALRTLAWAIEADSAREAA